MEPLFLFAKMFPKKLFIPKKCLSKYLYAYPNRKNKSHKCFNICLFRKNKSRKA